MWNKLKLKELSAVNSKKYTYAKQAKRAFHSLPSKKLHCNIIVLRVVDGGSDLRVI